MKYFLLAPIFLALTLPASAQQQARQKPARRPITKKTPDELPEGIHRFNGMIVGRLVSKDVEQGKLVVNVDAVPRVWRNNKAPNPKSIVGKNVMVDGVSGRFLDVLLIAKAGETVELEARHDRGNGLTFPGELLRKVAPYQPGDYPELPESFRGFNGAVKAKIMKKDPETFELIVKVSEVSDTWKTNRAKNPNSIVGKQMMLAGFWQRKETYHALKVGDVIEAGMRHITIRSDHMTVAEFVRKTNANSDAPKNAR